MKHILLIEDDDNLLNMLELSIRRSTEFNVTTAQNGTEAKALLNYNHWDLIVTDINLPDCTGLELAELIRTNNEFAKILMITGNNDTNNVIKALNLKVDAYLLKPFENNEFIDSITKLAFLDKNTAHAKKILAVGAHPDDIEIGCGGTLLNHKKNGDQIFALTLSNGERGGKSSIRSQEAQKASQLLGSQLTLCDLADTKISSGSETISLIENAITKYKPDVIYTHSKNDNHQDHRNVYQATIVAARSVPCIECYQSPSSNIDFKPSRFVDISQHMSGKIDLIKCFATQFNKCRYLKQSLIKANAEYWGRFANYSLVEPFEVIRSVK